MSTYCYMLRFSPYVSYMKCRNYKEAWEKFQWMFPEYNVREVGTLTKCYSRCSQWLV